MLSDTDAPLWSLVLVLTLCCRLTSSIGEPCKVDEAGTGGDCRRIFQCPILLDIFLMAKRGQTANIQFLRKMNEKCQHLPGTLVCCQNERTRTRTTPRSSTFSVPVNTGVVPSVPSALPNGTHCGTFSSHGRVVNGFDALVGQFPWMASIQYSVPEHSQLVHGCGGTLITSRHVLTAGHCVSFLEPVPKTVILGELDFNSDKDCLPFDKTVCSDPPKTIEIAAIRSHEQFENIEALAYPNDIAIIKLAEEVTFTDHIQPICLLQNTSVLGRSRDVSDQQVNRTLTIAGWGQSVADLDADRFTAQLQFGRVQVHSIDECEELFQQQLVRRTCAGGLVNKTDTCRGDSGGPLMVPVKQGFQWYQVGISSFGSRLCGHLAAYTRVLDYIDWIKKTIREL